MRKNRTTKDLAAAIAKVALLLPLFACFSFAQNAGTSAKPIRAVDEKLVYSTPAYAEILLRMTELKAEAESLALDYTDEYPKIKSLKFEIELLNSESDRLLAIKANELGKLTEALGKLILGKVSNQAKLQELRSQYADEHASVKRQRRKVEIYEAAIKQILG